MVPIDKGETIPYNFIPPAVPTMGKMHVDSFEEQRPIQKGHVFVEQHSRRVGTSLFLILLQKYIRKNPDVIFIVHDITTESNMDVFIFYDLRETGISA
jgi:hypothetical protein